VKKILISTGGSGGHVIPAIALFDHYRENFEIYLVSDRRGAKYIDQNKYPFEIIDYR
jgi:UDP-N-acetylglucosamine--N-acetylmuramyl-(pentapeptide) pyrophosphoryl-undecaprenol N-acetylglucosamine transferase